MTTHLTCPLCGRAHAVDSAELADHPDDGAYCLDCFDRTAPDAPPQPTALKPFDEPFPWTRQPEPPQQRLQVDVRPARQRVLFPGADCLAGQQDLF